MRVVPSGRCQSVALKPNRPTDRPAYSHLFNGSPWSFVHLSLCSSIGHRLQALTPGTNALHDTLLCRLVEISLKQLSAGEGLIVGR